MKYLILAFFAALLLGGTAYYLRSSALEQDGAATNQFSPIDTNDVGQTMALNAALKALSSQNGLDSFSYSKGYLLGTQIVAGVNYFLELQYQNKTGYLRAFTCTVWVKAWENFTQVSEIQEITVSQQSEQVGGWTLHTFDANNAVDVKALQVAQAAIQSQSSANLVNLGLQTCYTQVVSGINYKFNILYQQGDQDMVVTAIVYVVPWTNMYSVTSVQGLQVQTVQSTQQLQESEISVGGWTAHTFDANDATDAKALETAEAAVQAQSQTNLVNLGLQSCFTQVVAGVNYKFNIFYQNGNQNTVVTVVVYVVPWTNTYSVTSITGLNQQAAEVSLTAEGSQNVGGWTFHTYDANDAMDFKALQVAEAAVQAKSSANLVNLGLQSCYTQVVSGVNYKFNILYQNGNENMAVTVVVYVVPWTNTYKVTSITGLNSQ